MQGFNVVDYQEDDNDFIDYSTTKKVLNNGSRHHLVITGWSEDDVEGYSLEILFNDIFQLQDNVDEIKNNGSFHCLDLPLDDENDYHIINDLEFIVKCCLKYFNNYINVALAYKEDENGEIQYYYQTRITGNNLKHQIDYLKKLIPAFQKYKAVKCKPFAEVIIKKFLYPGIENVSGDSIDSIDKDVLDYLSEEIKKSILFFDLPYSVLSNTFHLYHHPKNSFPLPILLKSSQDMEKAEFWKGIDWKDDYKDYRDDFNNCKKYIVLGYYTRDNEDGCEGPHIVLCPKNIEAAASDSNLKDKKELLYLIVLIHELAHAMMDKNNVTMNSLFSNAMEESLANMITLQWFDVFDNDDKEIVKDFIKDKQPKIYKFGINQFEAGVDWSKWRDSKKMHKLLKEWFDNCFVPELLEQPQKVRAEYNRVLKQTKKQK